MLKLQKVNLNELEDIGLKKFKSLIFNDERGSLSIRYEGLTPNDKTPFSIKESVSDPYVGRGLHTQLKCPQTKVISLISGSILDFVYDPLSNDQTVYFFNLNSDDRLNIEIPGKFAHGFITIKRTVFSYITFGKYDEHNETTFNLLESAAKELYLPNISLSSKDRRYAPIDLKLSD